MPKFYLEGFTRDGFVWLFDRIKNEYRRQQPLKTAVIRNYYTFENKDGQKDYSIETFFSQIEGRAKKTIEELNAGKEITPEQRLYLASFISLLMVRSPKFDREVNEVADAAAKHIVKHAIPNIEAATELIRHHKDKQEDSEDKITPESLFEFINDEKFKLKMDRNFVIGAMLEQAQKVTFDVAMMDWLVIHAHPSTSFITTDEPIGFIVPEEIQRTGESVLGLASQKIVKVVPLSHSTALMLGKFGGGFGHQQAPRELIWGLNKLIATECDRYVIGRDEAHIKNVVNQSRVNKSNPGTKLKVEHIVHPTDPNRTFLVTRRVSADSPETPIKIMVDDPEEMKRFPQRFTLEENQKAVLDFEKLLQQYNMGIPPNSPLEEASISILEMLEIRKKKEIHNLKVDCRERWRQAFFLADVARKAVRAQAHADFSKLLSHLHLLLEPTNFSQFSAVDVTTTPKQKDTNNKIFELYVAVILFSILSDLQFDNPQASQGGNPDIIGKSRGKKWGFACKVSHSENPLAFLAQVRKGIDQIEKADVDHGLIVVNLKNLIPHDIIWPAIQDKKTGIWSYLAFPLSDGPANLIESEFQRFQNNVYSAIGGRELFINEFKGKKAVPLVLVFYSSVASYSPKYGVVIPFIVKRLFGVGTSLEKLTPEAREIAKFFNDYLHDKTS